MKHLLWSIVATMAVLVAAVTGCGRAPRYDARLVAIDSLMHDAPDSALALVQAIGTLPAPADRAYRDLLLTQARYRCYVTATSDSDINRALDYYRAHSGEREKLTRAFIYKGAVMDELGHPDSAMLYYKHAEATAAPDDYFNLGYAKMRIGALYRDHFSMEGKDIEKYEEALECLRRSDNINYQIACMINLGSLYRLHNPDKSESILLAAKSLAMHSGDTIRYRMALNSLLQTYYVKGKYQDAKVVIKEMLDLYPEKTNLEFYTNAASVYAKLGMPDSAEIFLRQVDTTHYNNVIEEMLYIESVGEIALARGDTGTYHLMENKCVLMQDSILAQDTAMRLQQTEVSYDKDSLQERHHRYHLTSTWLYIILAVLAFVTIGLYYFIHRAHRYDKLISELREASSTHIEELNMLQARINDMGIRDEKLINYFDSHLWLIREVIEECYNVPNSKLVKKLKSIISFQEHNKDNWYKLFAFIDMRYNNILLTTRKNYPQLNDKDLLLIALTTLDFSCVQISMIMGYANPTSVGVIRQRLAQKMGIECSIKQFVDAHTTGNV